MKGRVVALGRWNGREAAALVEDGVLEDLLVAPPEDRPAPGAIFRAVAERPVKGQGGIFIRLPGGTGFLRQGTGLRPGSSLLVQVTGFAERGKAVPVTDRLLFKSRFAIVTPGAPGLNLARTIREPERRAALRAMAEQAAQALPEGAGLILRSAAEGGEDRTVADDIRAMAEAVRAVTSDAGTGPARLLDGPTPAELAWRDWPEPDELADNEEAFAAHGIDAMIEALRSPLVALPGGGAMFVEPTRALVAVDVNTGGDTSPAAGLKANLGAARAMPRALRCRGLGGQVTIDFAPSPKKDRRTVEQTLQAAFRADSVETALAGWTPLGHFEIQRKRERLPLEEVLR